MIFIYQYQQSPDWVKELKAMMKIHEGIGKDESNDL
jgi:hypothetical protein